MYACMFFLHLRTYQLCNCIIIKFMPQVSIIKKAYNLLKYFACGLKNIYLFAEREFEECMFSAVFCKNGKN